MIGRIFKPNEKSHNKNHEIILKIFTSMHEKNFDFEFKIIGFCNDYKYLNYLKKYEIENKISILNDISDSIKNKLLETSEFIIQATGMNLSEQDKCFAFEHFGISVIEGLNYGCIPIVTNGGFFPYYIKHNRNGFLFKNTSEAKDIIMSILNQSRKLNTKKIQDYNYTIIKKFDKDNYMKNFKEILYSL